MRRCSVAVLVATLLALTALAVDLELTVTSKIPLKGELQDLVTFGLLKEMTCDTKGNIFSPSNRKYGSAINAIVRFPHDASSFTTFSIDSLPALERGTIVDFEPEPGGGVFVLAREVLKYSDVEVPVEFGRTFLIRYDQDGKILSRLELKLNTENFKPTSMSMLKGGEILVVGNHSEGGKTFVISEVFLPDGSLKTRLTLNPGGTKSSNTGKARSGRVFDPIAIKVSGIIYVLRGTTTEPIYVLSESGQVLRTTQLKPADIEFDSPKILETELVVSQHRPIPPEQNGIVIRQREPVELPVFSLTTGEIVDRYIWHNKYTGGLACAAPQSLTLIGQDDSTRGHDWTIFEASRVGSSVREHLAMVH